MKVGLYFGSFNPIHVGHLIIANNALNETDLDQVWFVISPQNPFKNPESLLSEYHRLHLIRSAIDGEPNLRVTNIEFGLPRPSYTVDTLVYIQEKYPSNTFCILIGSDSFQNIDKWKNYKSITENHTFYVFKRPGFEIKESYGATIHVLNTPLLEISSTYVRKLIKQKKSIRFLVPDKVKEEIDLGGYYKTIKKISPPKGKSKQ